MRSLAELRNINPMKHLRVGPNTYVMTGRSLPLDHPQRINRDVNDWVGAVWKEWRREYA